MQSVIQVVLKRLKSINTKGSCGLFHICCSSTFWVLELLLWEIVSPSLQNLLRECFSLWFDKNLISSHGFFKVCHKLYSCSSIVQGFNINCAYFNSVHGRDLCLWWLWSCVSKKHSDCWDRGKAISFSVRPYEIMCCSYAKYGIVYTAFIKHIFTFTKQKWKSEREGTSAIFFHFKNNITEYLEFL